MSSLNLNKVILCGRLTADPELKQTPNGISCLSFTIAVNRRYQSKSDSQAAQQADFISAVAWRQTAEFISRYFIKGSAICVTGSIQTRSWTDQQGQKRYATDVVVDEAMFVDSKNENPSASFGGNGSYDVAPAYSSGNNVASSFEEIKTDDDLPF